MVRHVLDISLRSLMHLTQEITQLTRLTQELHDLAEKMREAREAREALPREQRLEQLTQATLLLMKVMLLLLQVLKKLPLMLVREFRREQELKKAEKIFSAENIITHIVSCIAYLLLNEEQKANLDDLQDVWLDKGVKNWKLQLLTFKFVAGVRLLPMVDFFRNGLARVQKVLAQFVI